jgi:pimeloyl-ACP methyl ester carboxylesterase
MATFVVAHGAWSSSWAWKKMRPLMRAAGHEFYVPAYTGLGERAHAATPSVTLDTHIADVLGVIEMEDLQDIVLVGHSYGGMVATAVAAAVRDRVRHLVYLDAFVPRPGQSILDLQGPEQRARVIEAAGARGQGWRVPPQPPPPDTPPDDIAWMLPRRMPQSLLTFTTPLSIDLVPYAGDRTYIFCTRVGPTDSFRQFADHARHEPGWACLEIDASHNPHITMPESLMALLDGIAGVDRVT